MLLVPFCVNTVHYFIYNKLVSTYVTDSDTYLGVVYKCYVTYTFVNINIRLFDMSHVN